MTFTIRDAYGADIERFIGGAQLPCICELLDGEEGEFYHKKLLELANLFRIMPKTYDQEELGDLAVVHLHYFAGGQANWWITERDKLSEQHQAFGLADLYDDGGELGYISIVEILENGGELDLHWKPITLRELREQRDARRNPPPKCNFCDKPVEAELAHTNICEDCQKLLRWIEHDEH